MTNLEIKNFEELKALHPQDVIAEVECVDSATGTEIFEELLNATQLVLRYKTDILGEIQSISMAISKKIEGYDEFIGFRKYGVDHTTYIEHRYDNQTLYNPNKDYISMYRVQIVRKIEKYTNRNILVCVLYKIF